MKFTYRLETCVHVAKTYEFWILELLQDKVFFGIEKGMVALIIYLNLGKKETHSWNIESHTQHSGDHASQIRLDELGCVRTSFYFAF